MSVSKITGEYHFADVLHTSSSYPKFLELVGKYCSRFSEVRNNQIRAVDLGSGDCERMSEYLQFSDIIHPIELDRTNCLQAEPHLRKLANVGKTIVSFSNSGGLKPNNCKDLESLVRTNSVHVVTSRGGPEQGILEQVWSVLVDDGLYIKSGHIPSMEALEALREIRPSGFEDEIIYAEKRSEGLSSYTTQIEASGFTILEGVVTNEAQEFDESRMLKLLGIPAVFGEKFDPSVDTNLFRKFCTLTQVDEKSSNVFRTKSQDVLIVARKIAKEPANA